jgi:hypothetical protein
LKKCLRAKTAAEATTRWRRAPEEWRATSVMSVFVAERGGEEGEKRESERKKWKI